MVRTTIFYQNMCPKNFGLGLDEQTNICTNILVSVCLPKYIGHLTILVLTLRLLNMTCHVLANSVDPDQLASEEAN